MSAGLLAEPVPMVLHCPECKARHIDEGEFATKPHHTHACQSCGMVWRPSVVSTVGVRFLPGFKNERDHEEDEALEAAFWHYDTLHKQGTKSMDGTRLSYSERDAFKRAVRPLLRAAARRGAQ